MSAMNDGFEEQNEKHVDATSIVARDFQNIYFWGTAIIFDNSNNSESSIPTAKRTQTHLASAQQAQLLLQALNL